MRRVRIGVKQRRARKTEFYLGIMPLCAYTDSHVHIGPFSGGLMFEPEEVAAALLSFGVKRWAYFSTAFLCLPQDYILWFRECVERMETVAPGCGVPLLWMNEYMLRHSDRFFDTRFCGIKVHEGLEELSPPALESAFDIAQGAGVPLILHTGDDGVCAADKYDSLCYRYDNLSVVLAHGRPADKVLPMLRRHPNIWVDTAFMPASQVKQLCLEGQGHRLLFGSDYPIDRYFYSNEAEETLYSRHRASVLRIAGIAPFVCFEHVFGA